MSLLLSCICLLILQIFSNQLSNKAAKWILNRALFSSSVLSYLKPWTHKTNHPTPHTSKPTCSEGRRNHYREHSRLLFAMERIFCTSCCTPLLAGVLPLQFSSTESLIQNSEDVVLSNQHNSFFHVIILWAFTPVKTTCIPYCILPPTNWKFSVWWKRKLNFIHTINPSIFAL